MEKLEIIQSAYHANTQGEPFVVAIVDDVETDDTKLVIMFEDDGYTAVLSLDQIIDEEDISTKLISGTRRSMSPAFVICCGRLKTTKSEIFYHDNYHHNII